MKPSININASTILILVAGFFLYRKIKAGFSIGTSHILNIGTIASQAEAEQVLKYLFENSDKFATGTVGEIPVEGLWFVPVSQQPRDYFNYSKINGNWEQMESFTRVWNVAEPIEKIIYTQGKVFAKGKETPTMVVSPNMPGITTTTFNTVQILNPYEIQKK